MYRSPVALCPQTSVPMRPSKVAYICSKPSMCCVPHPCAVCELSLYQFVTPQAALCYHPFTSACHILCHRAAHLRLFCALCALVRPSACPCVPCAPASPVSPCAPLCAPFSLSLLVHMCLTGCSVRSRTCAVAHLCTPLYAPVLCHCAAHGQAVMCALRPSAPLCFPQPPSLCLTSVIARSCCALCAHPSLCAPRHAPVFVSAPDVWLRTVLCALCSSVQPLLPLCTLSGFCVDDLHNTASL